MTTELTSAEAEGLRIARMLVEAGIPVFAAAPCPAGCRTKGHGERTEFHLPNAWEKITPSIKQLERWQPGWALAAMGGHAADFIDQDDHHGGDISVKELCSLGGMPRVFGVQTTPSGGKHYLISPVRERRAAGIMPGLDYQGGDGQGVGRAFVWLAPTVKRSKNVEDGGALGTYEWMTPPDLAMLAEFAGSDDSGTHLRDLVVRSHGGTYADAVVEKAEAVVAAALADDPFMTASQVPEVRKPHTPFTIESATAFTLPAREALAHAQIGDIEDKCNKAAAMLSHFVPEFMSADVAFGVLKEALEHTAYDPNGPSDWTVDKFLPVLDGRRPPRDNWKAEKVESGTMAGAIIAENPSVDEVQQFISTRMFSAEEMAARPAPEPLVWGLLDRDSLAAVFGEPGSFKSFWALDLAGHVGRGMSWHGHRVEQGTVIYIAAEGDRGMTLRTQAWMRKYGPMENVIFLPEPIQVADVKAWNLLVAVCERIQPAFVVGDTQSMMTLGMEENSNTEMNTAMAAFRRIHRASKACVLVVHHTGKEGGKIRGGSAQEGAHDTRIRLDRVGARSDMFFTMKDEKQKDMAEGENGAVKMRMNVVDLGADLVTGRQLSSLVVSSLDVFEEASGQESRLDVGQEEVLPEPVTGWQRVGVTEAPLQERALTVLLEVAGPEGITESVIKKLVVERWHPNGTGSKAGQLRNSAWQAAWGKALAREWDGESLIVSGRTGDRYRVNDLVAGLVKTAASASASG